MKKIKLFSVEIPLQPYNERPNGFIAYKDESPIGCIGIINRQIQNDSNKKQYATWFADWFIIKEAQGLGIGKTLIKNVFDLSDKAFGIAGPLHAQKIAKKVGYNNFNGYYNIIIPLNIIKCGMKRFSGGIHKKLYRILYIFYIHFFKKIIDRSKNYKIKFEKPSINLLYDSSNNCLNKKKSGCLCRINCILNGFLKCQKKIILTSIGGIYIMMKF